MRRALRLAALGACLLALGGCMRGCASSRPPIHLNPNMDDQPKVTAMQASDFFYDGKSMRSPVEGTVALDEAVDPGAFETGRSGPETFVAGVPPEAASHFAVSLAERGADRFAIYCAPCHGERGDGHGMLYRRAGVESADLRQARLRAAPAGQIFDTITHGLGLMPSYAAQIPPADRWAIVAHVRALQAEVPADEGSAAAAAAAPAPAAPGSAATDGAGGAG